MGLFDDIVERFKNMRDRRWDIVREETARYRAGVLKKMTVEQAYEEFLALYELGESIASDLDSLKNKETETRIRIVGKRQAAFRAVANPHDFQ